MSIVTQRRTLHGLALAGVLGLALLASACGGSPSGAKVAQIGTTNANNSSAKNPGHGDAMAYSRCMRSHGVPNFPDPDSSGRILITSGVGPGGQKTGVDMNTPQAKRASRTCQKLNPEGGRPSAAQQAKQQQMMLAYAQCMRSHGVPKFPDPKAGGALVIGTKNGVDPNSPQFKTAQAACQKLLPGSPVAPPPSAPPSSGSGSGSGSGGSSSSMP